ncbi:acyl-CoA thioesterase [Streptomyces sp. C10-9-1]|uniref:acyl-CoA thioesterase n=1 Tax=Streptomyces sp. C10-9-1 TaxID=1859285 RepID=UPI003D742C76
MSDTPQTLPASSSQPAPPSPRRRPAPPTARPSSREEGSQPLPDPAGISLAELLDVQQTDRDRFRADVVFDEPYDLYGGQVAAQALVAAGRTVPEGRAPHSLHAYFLRAGSADRPTEFRVERDRDGRSYSARRVVALQDDRIVFSVAASFHAAEEGRDQQVSALPDVPSPNGLPPTTIPRLASFEARQLPQPDPQASWPSRIWARCTADLGDDPLLHAGVLTYLSDMFTGLVSLRDQDFLPMSSLDHAVWFHRPARLDDWVLLDLVPHTVAHGRGWYTGTVSSPDGVLRASLTQEQLFRRHQAPKRLEPGTT